MSRRPPRRSSSPSIAYFLFVIVALAVLWYLARTGVLPTAVAPASETSATALGPAATELPASQSTPQPEPPAAAAAVSNATVASAPTGQPVAEAPQATPTRRATSTPTRGPPQIIDGLPTITTSELPVEALATLALIEQGGPFPFNKDGTVFQNREGLLPPHERGYYHEYTVITPGENDRGARRIVAGDGGELYYTDDHYASFKRIVWP